MSKVERKEYHHETKVYKTKSPGGRLRGSAQDLTEFDHNLDNLLEDLQSSVARPQGNAYRETRIATRDVDRGRSNSLNRVTHLKSSNPVNEYSSDDSYTYTTPDGARHLKSIKKESYSYSTAGKSNLEQHRMQSSIDQLDSLLDDLKQVKHVSNNSTGLEPGLVETGKSRVVMGKKVVERDIAYVDPPPRPSSRSGTLSRSDREGSLSRDIVQYIDEGTYGETRPVRYTTPSPAPSATSTLTKQKKVTNVHSYPVEVLETTTPAINPEILANLDPNLLPSGNTKVTTTIKTYTYELPGSGSKLTGTSPEPDRYIYSPNQSQTTPSRSFVYSKVENKENVTYPPEETTTIYKDYKESSSKSQTVPAYQPGADSTVVKETTTTRNYQPGYQVYPDTPPSSKQTYLYNETKTTKNYYPESPRPSSREAYLIKESRTTTKPYSNGYPPQETVIYKHDSHTNYNQPPKTPEPVRDVNYSYKYSSSTSTTNKYGHPDDSEPLLRPFPKDGSEGPPKRVEDLMAEIGREPPDSHLNAGYKAHEVELIHQKKVDTLKQQQGADLQKKERNVPPTKNITGPAVYYPPGEMFAKKEEGNAWRAQGAMAKESGKYKYEADGGSKTKTKTGAAIVPVCLPLCCGIPCTIM